MKNILRCLRFSSSSLASAGVDFLLFYLLLAVIPLERAQAVFAATIIARIGSGAVNFLLNRIWSFNSKMPAFGEAVRYGTVFVAKMALSAWTVSLLSGLPMPTVIVKIAVDTLLFFASYFVQDKWVFKNRQKENFKKN